MCHLYLSTPYICSPTPALPPRPCLYQFGLPHPDPVVENASLAAVEPPDITYELGLDPTIIDKGLLSDLQLETVTYACQRHEVRR